MVARTDVETPIHDLIREKLPNPIKDLADLAYNYWWSWNRRATRLWEYIDPEHWKEHNNPVKLLLDVSEERLEELLKTTTS